MGHTEVAPGEAMSSQRQSYVKDGKTIEQCILYIKLLSCALAVFAAISIIMISVLSWHIANSDQDAAQLKQDTDKSVTVDECPDTTVSNTARPPITFDEILAIINQTDVKSFLLHEVQAIIKATDRRFDHFNATTEETLAEIHQKIDQLETGKASNTTRPLITSNGILAVINRTNAMPFFLQEKEGFVVELRLVDRTLQSNLLTIPPSSGNYYDSKSHAYTAPIAGMYIFTLKIQCLPQTTEVHIHLMKNDMFLAVVKGAHHINEVCVPEYVVDVLKLDAGHTVKANLTLGTGHVDMEVGIFSGKLLIEI